MTIGAARQRLASRRSPEATIAAPPGARVDRTLSGGMGGMHDNLALPGVVFAALGGVSIVVELVQMLRAIVSSHWDWVDGEIEDVGVKEGQKYDGARVIPVYRPIVRYRYSLNGRTYSGERLGFQGLASSSLAAARRTTKRYDVHEVVKVYVSPRDPTFSVIEVGVQRGHWLGLALGFVWLVVGCAMILPQFGAHIWAWITSGIGA